MILKLMVFGVGILVLIVFVWPALRGPSVKDSDSLPPLPLTLDDIYSPPKKRDAGAGGNDAW